MLKSRGFKPKRTIHISIVPDEEIFGIEGMGCLVKHEIFKELNIGAALDEGGAFPEDYLILFYGERAPWNLIVTANGDTGHSSKFVENLAINKLTKFFNYVEKFRKEEQSRSRHVELGKVTTMNLVKLGGGTADNVVPDTLWANYNIRVSPTFNTKTLKQMLSKWAKYSDVTLEYINDIEPTMSPHDGNAYVYNAIIESTEELGTPVRTFVCQGATDSRYLRFQGIPSYSFTPCTNVEFRMHDHNEFVPVRCLQTGLRVYYNMLEKLANLEEI
jgi:N-acyl-L-amino-acid amidohydrolase